jgi:carboxyl-terminal processing protease
VRRRPVLAAVAATVLAFGLGVALRPLDLGGNEAAPKPTVLEGVRTELATRYYRQLPARVLRLGSVDAMLAALHDPYTRYLPPGELRLASRALHEGFSGVGLTLIPGETGLLVTRTEPGPARIAGIRPGDTILAVDGSSAASLSFDDAVGRIVGREGSLVQLRVLRDNRTLTYDLVRQRFRRSSVSARMLDGRVGSIRIERFAVGTAKAARAATRRLESKGARGLVLDLRGNPGGLLRQAVAVASLFLEEGRTVVALTGVNRPESLIYAHRGQKTRLPVVVLVDRRSASAAEVVAAALHEHGRALVLGEPTFGKSLVQEIDRLPAGGALKLTVATYRTPTGRDISAGGVVPDVGTRQPLRRALALLARR